MSQNNQNEHAEFEQEYKQTRADVKKVVLMNLLFIIILVVLYIANQKYGFLSALNKLF